ncbi:hypothetical protein BC567DRAFT_35638 [Phyllosticta citribraziliensis]
MLCVDISSSLPLSVIVFPLFQLTCRAGSAAQPPSMMHPCLEEGGEKTKPDGHVDVVSSSLLRSVFAPYWFSESCPLTDDVDTSSPCSKSSSRSIHLSLIPSSSPSSSSFSCRHRRSEYSATTWIIRGWGRGPTDRLSMAADLSLACSSCQIFSITDMIGCTAIEKGRRAGWLAGLQADLTYARHPMAQCRLSHPLNSLSACTIRARALATLCKPSLPVSLSRRPTPNLRRLRLCDRGSARIRVMVGLASPASASVSQSSTVPWSRATVEVGVPHEITGPGIGHEAGKAEQVGTQMEGR